MSAKAAKKSGKIIGRLRTYIPAGKASASPPLGPQLGQKGVNISQFCKDFNDKTKEVKPGVPIPTRIVFKADRSYSFETTTPPVSFFLKQAAGIDKGASKPGGILCAEQEFSLFVSSQAEKDIKTFNSTNKILL